MAASKITYPNKATSDQFAGVEATEIKNVVNANADLLDLKVSFLTPTAIKTAAYTAAVGDLVLVDATSGIVPITFPTGVTNKSQIAVKIIALGSGFSATLILSGSDVFNKAGGSTSGSLLLLNQLITFQYNSSSGIWYGIGSDLSLTQLDVRYAGSIISTPTLPATTGTVSVPFTGNKIYQTATQTGNISFVPDMTGAVNGAEVIVVLIGNNVGSITLPVLGNLNGNTPDNTKSNTFTFKNINGSIKYTVNKEDIPDTIPPTITSKSVAASSPSVLDLTFSEAVNITPSGFTIATTGAAISVSSVSTGSGTTTPKLQLSRSVLSTETLTLSYDSSVGNTLDISGNELVSFTNSAISNTVSSYTNTRSLSVGAFSQIPKNSVIPATLQFGAGTGELPMTNSFLLKVNSLTAGDQMVWLIGDNATFGVLVKLDNAGKLNFLFSSSTGSISGKTTSAIPTGQWLNIALPYNGNRTFAGNKIYINGTSVALTDTSGTGYAGKPTYPSGTRLYIGGSSGTGAEATGVLIDHVMFANIELTSTQVTELWNGGFNKDPSTLSFAANIVDMWDFESNLNSSVSGYNLTSTNPPTYSTDHL